MCDCLSLRRSRSTALWIAVFAAVAGSAGDFGMLYVGQQAGNATLTWPPPPAATLELSQWLGAFSIPLYSVGYIHLAGGLRGRGRSLVFWLGIYASALGGAIHAVMGVIIHYAPVDSSKAAGAFAVDPGALPFLLPFVATVVLGLTAASAGWSIAVLRRASEYPRWLGVLNPMSCILIVTLAGLAFPLGRLFLVPMAPNVGSAMFFALAILARREDAHT